MKKKTLKRLLKATQDVCLEQQKMLQKQKKETFNDFAFKKVVEDRDEWKRKANENLKSYEDAAFEVRRWKTAQELLKKDRNEWKEAANKAYQLYNNSFNKRNEELKLQRQLIEVLDLCFGVMMQPHEIKVSIQACGPDVSEPHKLGINTNALEWIEARQKAEKLYYELKNALKKNDPNETANHFQDSFRYAMTALKPETELTGNAKEFEIDGEVFKNELSKQYEKHYPSGEDNIRKQEFHISDAAKSSLAAKMPSVREAENHDPEKNKGL